MYKRLLIYFWLYQFFAVDLIAVPFIDSNLIVLLDDSEFIQGKNDSRVGPVVLRYVSANLIKALEQKIAPIVVSTSLMVYFFSIKHRLFDRDGNFSFPDNYFDDYICKKIDDSICLLVPRNYKNLSELKTYKAHSIQPSDSLSLLELRLGLKIDHLEDIDFNFFKNPLYVPILKLFNEDAIQAIQNIFISTKEYKKLNLEIPRWAFLLRGHGQIVEQLLKELKSQVVKLFSFEELEIFLQSLNTFSIICGKIYQLPENTDPKSLINFLEEIKVGCDNLQIVAANTHLVDIIEKTKQELIALEDNSGSDDFFKIIKKFINIDIKNTLDQSIVFAFYNKLILTLNILREKNEYAIVCDLPLSYFSKFLDFLDEKVTTKFLFFSSCYAGGKTLELLYKTQQDVVQKIYNYTIASNAIADIPSTVSFKTNKLIDSKFNLEIYLDFTSFFNSLSNDDVIDFTKTLDYVAQMYGIQRKISEFQNIPLLKFPGMEWISVIDIPKKIVSIGKILSETHDPDEALDVSVFFGGRLTQDRDKIKKVYPEIILLYTETVPFKLKLHKTVPSLLSMISGNVVHLLEGIDFLDAVNPMSFFQNSLIGFLSEKLIIIKEMRFFKLGFFKDRTLQAHFSDIILYNNIKEPFSGDDQNTSGVFYTDTMTQRRYQYSVAASEMPRKLIGFSIMAEISKDYLEWWLEKAVEVDGERHHDSPAINLSKLQEFMQHKAESPMPEIVERSRILQVLEEYITQFLADLHLVLLLSA